MNDQDLNGSVGQLVISVVTAAAESGLDPAKVISCLGFASKIVMQQSVAAGGPQLDPYTAFAKGLAQMAEVQPAAYH